MTERETGTQGMGQHRLGPQESGQHAMGPQEPGTQGLGPQGVGSQEPGTQEPGPQDPEGAVTAWPPRRVPVGALIAYLLVAFGASWLVALPLWLSPQHRWSTQAWHGWNSGTLPEHTPPPEPAKSPPRRTNFPVATSML